MDQQEWRVEELLGESFEVFARVICELLTVPPVRFSGDGVEVVEVQEAGHSGVVVAHDADCAALPKALEARHGCGAVTYGVSEAQHTVDRLVLFCLSEYRVECVDVAMDIADDECTHLDIVRWAARYRCRLALVWGGRNGKV